MVFLQIEIINYQQIAKIRADLIESIQQNLSHLLNPYLPKGVEWSHEQPILAFSVTRAGMIREVIDLILKVYTVLEKDLDDLFDYNLFIANGSETDDADIKKRFRRITLKIESEREIWVDDHSVDFFQKYFEIDRLGECWRVVKPFDIARASERKEERWIREHELEKILDSISRRLNDVKVEEIPYFSGHHGIGVTTLVIEAIKRVLGREKETSYIRIEAAVKDNSYIKPFVESIDHSFFGECYLSLKKWERRVWDEHGELMSRLLAGKRIGPSAYLLEEMLLGYQLYLLSFVRRMTELDLPAFFICDNFEMYHPQVRRYIVNIIRDLSRLPAFFPLFTSHAKSVPTELECFSLNELVIEPLGCDEIRLLSKKFHPHLQLADAICEKIRFFSGGLIVPVVHYLKYCSLMNSVDVELPEKSLSVSWFLLKSLDQNAKEMLYALYLTRGIINKADFLMLCASLGFDEDTARDAMDCLVEQAFVTQRRGYLPHFPGLKMILAKHLGDRALNIEQTIAESLMRLWESNSFRNGDALLDFFLRSRHIDFALNVLPEIMQKKIDERNLNAVYAFPRRDVSRFLTQKQTEKWRYIVFTAKLRATLVANDNSQAQAIYKNIQSDRRIETGENLKNPFAGELQLQKSNYHLHQGEIESAIIETKRALLVFQDQENSSGERDAYLFLGSVLLAQGKLEDAAEYLTLAEKICFDPSDPVPGARLIYLKAVALFVRGNIPQADSILATGISFTRKTNLRDWEIFFLFFKARLLFELGLYRESGDHIEGALAITTVYNSTVYNSTVYNSDEAVAVLYSWLARSFVFAGFIQTGLKILKKLHKSREILFFMAEAYFFLGDLKRSRTLLDRAVGIDSSAGYCACERPLWEDGFYSIEGRIHQLSERESLLTRLVNTFRAYISAKEGASEKGLQDLYLYARRERMSQLDPYLSLYNFLYFLVIPEFGGEEADDRFTVLNKAYKLLQERSMRIADESVRKQFMKSNYWNQRLSEEAMKVNLV